MNSVLLDMSGLVRMTAEDAAGIMLPRILQRSRGYLRRHPQPARVQAVDQPHDWFALEIKFLQLEIDRRAQPAEPEVVDLKSVELMPVNRNVALSREIPDIALVNPHAHQVRHDVGQTVVVIAFHPHNFYFALRIRQLADVAEKLPVLFGEAGEIKVGENVAEKDQAAEDVFLEHASRFPRMARLRAKVQVGKDQRVVHGQIHIPIVVRQC
jgi:hypothetical protein